VHLPDQDVAVLHGLPLALEAEHAFQREYVLRMAQQEPIDPDRNPGSLRADLIVDPVFGPVVRSRVSEVCVVDK
jgi:hypothetical protein